jgi:hypothetical protein
MRVAATAHDLGGAFAFARGGRLGEPPARDTSAGCCVISANGLILKVKPSGVRSAHSFALRSAGRATHQDLARNARLP